MPSRPKKDPQTYTFHRHYTRSFAALIPAYSITQSRFTPFRRQTASLHIHPINTSSHSHTQLLNCNSSPLFPSTLLSSTPLRDDHCIGSPFISLLSFHHAFSPSLSCSAPALQPSFSSLMPSADSQWEAPVIGTAPPLVKLYAADSLHISFTDSHLPKIYRFGLPTPMNCACSLKPCINYHKKLHD